MPIGEAVLVAAKKKKLTTHDEIAAACGLSRSFVTRIVGGKRRKLSAETLMRLARGLGVSMEFLAKNLSEATTKKGER